jgi:hypothetical protein
MAAQDQKAAKDKARRAQQKVAISSVGSRLASQIGSIEQKLAACKALAHHIAGFYEEVDKLAKGKALMAATDLSVDSANSIVRDAKTMIRGDPHLDRIKEFVPAGDNPVYPDILLVTRAAQQAVERYQVQLEGQRAILVGKVREVKTLLSALRFYLDANLTKISLEDIKTMVNDPDSDWFLGGYGMFNWHKLDNRNIAEYLSEGVPEDLLSTDAN